MKAKITGIVITKNEEEMIEECLKNLDFCDEVLVIDNNSSDKTVDLAKKHGALVTSLETDDFSALRNKGKELASNRWVLYVDADERLDETLSENVLKAIEAPSFNAYKVNRKNYFLGQPSPKIEKILRLFDKEKLTTWKGKLHESPIVVGEVGELSGYLFHFTHRSLEAMLNKTNEWSEIEAETRFKMGHPKMSWWRFLRVMMSQFFRSYFTEQGFKMGTAGLVESIYQTYSIFITYSKLWELQKK